MRLNNLRRLDVVQVAVDEKFEQVFGIVSRATFAVVVHLEVVFFHFDAFHKHVNQSHLIIRIYYLV